MFGGVLGFVTDHLGTILGIVGTSIAAYGAFWGVMKTGQIIIAGYNIALGIWAAFQSAVPISVGASTVALNAYNITTKAVAAATWLWNSALFACPIVWIIAGILALGAGIYLLVKHWDKVKVAMGNFFSAIWSGLRKTAKFIFDLLLTPVTLFLKLIAKVSGAQWAKDAISGINKLSDSIGGETKPTTNVAAAQTSVQNSRYEEIKKQQVDIQLTNKTDKNAVLKSNPAQMPKISTTN